MLTHEYTIFNMELDDIIQWIKEKFFVILIVVLAVNLIILLGPTIITLMLFVIAMSIPLVLVILGLAVIFKLIKVIRKLLS